MQTTRDIHRERMAWLQSLTELVPTGQCIDWPWGLAPNGYPLRVHIGDRNVQVAHVLMELLGHPRPAGRMILHSCDRRACLAPWHLRWGTHQQNMDDKRERHRGRTRRGEAHHAAKLTAEIVQQIRRAIDDGATQHSQAALYGVSQSAISLIVNQKVWT